MKWGTSIRLLFALALTTASLEAQVPHLINYQGRLAVNGVNFDGAGQFKFALVSRDGATTHWSNDGTSTGGSEPTDAVALPVAHGLYSVLLGDPALAHMTEVPPAAFASGDVWLRVWFNDGTNGFQQLKPDQRLAAVGYAMLAANVPAGAITADQLADQAITPAKLAPGAAAQNLQSSGGLILSDQVNATNLLAAGFVKIGTVNATADGWQTIGKSVPPAARQYHTAVWTGTEMIIWGADQPAAYLAGTASEGGRYNPALDTWTTISTNNAPIQRLHHGAVWTGREMLVWGGSIGGADRDTGARYDPSTNSWRGMTTNNAPDARHDFASVWTGSELLIWGGRAGNLDLATGGHYNPATDVWGNLTTTNAPEARAFPAAVWTGDRLVIWSGLKTLADTTVLYLRTGGIYDPETDTWQPTAVENSPFPRLAPPSAVWTGQEMLVWAPTPINNVRYKLGRFQPALNTWTASSGVGLPHIDSTVAVSWTGKSLLVWGTKAGQPLGGRYDPATDSWQPMHTNDSRLAAPGDSVIWAGNEMIIWGGSENAMQPRPWGPDGARYDPQADLWRQVGARPAPRLDHTAVWTGSEMIVWGGAANPTATTKPLLVPSGGVLNPATGAWRPISTAGAPAARQNHTAVWTGNEMLIWGGYGFEIYGPAATLQSGGRYNPATDAWTAMETNGAPVPRMLHTAIWTGREMIIWGGRKDRTSNLGLMLADGSRYAPDLDSWESLSGTDAPTPRYGHTAVWTGEEMLVWGGYGQLAPGRFGNGPLGNGARYHAASHRWLPLASTNAPTGRQLHTAIWTGREMIVWGGAPEERALYFDSGGRYDPSNDLWRKLASQGAPSGRIYHTAVWTGSEMIVWGGSRAYDFSPFSSLGSGARFNPIADTWLELPVSGAPAARARHTAVWTGDTMLVFGGGQGKQLQLPEPVWSYSLTKPLYLYQKP